MSGIEQSTILRPEVNNAAATGASADQLNLLGLIKKDAGSSSSGSDGCGALKESAKKVGPEGLPVMGGGGSIELLDHALSADRAGAVGESAPIAHDSDISKKYTKQYLPELEINHPGPIEKNGEPLKSSKHYDSFESSGFTKVPANAPKDPRIEMLPQDPPKDPGIVIQPQGF